MTNDQAIKALEEIKTYTAATRSDEIEYVIDIMKKLEAAGVSKPLEADFEKIKN